MERYMCRTCLTETDDSIFKTIFLADKELALVDMLHECMGLKVTESDEISLNMCDICTDQIINYYVFRKKCLDSNQFLLRRLEEKKQVSIPIKYIEDTESETVYDEVPMTADLEEEDSNDSIPKLSTEKNLTCELCDSKYSNKNLLLDHLLIVHNIVEYEKYECEFCKKCYETSNGLRQHITNYHASDPPKFICDHCGQIFKVKVNLNLHLRRHTGEKPFKCDFCDYRSVQQTSVTIHMRTHTGERPYKCEICGKLFRTSSSRAIHLRGHSDETPYECIVCLKKFKKRDIYKEHMAIHEPDKYMECNYCGKKFARKDNLNIHIKQHTGEKPYVCKYCGKDFIQKHCWKTHIKNHHNK